RLHRRLGSRRACEFRFDLAFAVETELALELVPCLVVRVAGDSQAMAALEPLDGCLRDRTEDAVLLRFGETEELLQAANGVAAIDRPCRHAASQDLGFRQDGSGKD